MRTIEEYRRHASECRQLATRARSPEEKEMIQKMMETWEELATTREHMLRKRGQL